MKKRLHVLSNTHWDREHRHGFQETRIMLVEMMDKLIDIMENDEHFRYFTFDGQTVMLEDYLEIKPYMKERLQALVKTGRIFIGPWYTLPDCTPANPESLIRNLLKGHRLGKEFGGVMKAGYSIFSFGQIAQLPQLYAGFDIHDLIFYKHASTEVFKKSEFVWEASDGTQALCSRLGKRNRLNFFALFTVPVMLGGNMVKDWNIDYTSGRRLTHFVDINNSHQNATELEPDIRIRKENIKRSLKDVFDSLEETVAEKTFVAFDGIDFSAPLKELPEALADADEIAGNNTEILHSNLIDYFREFRKEVKLDLLMRYKGEMRFGPIDRVHSETLSGNMLLKQRMFEAETLILKYAEPFSVFAFLGGEKYPKDLLGTAWKYILKSQAHDSFHGAGVAEIKAHTLHTLAQAKEIGEGISRRAIEQVIASINTDEAADDDILLSVFNPTTSNFSGIIRTKIDLPRMEYVRNYHIEDFNGRRLNYFQHFLEENNLAAVNIENRPKAVYTKQAELELEVEDIPSFGYRTFKIIREKGTVSDAPGPFGEPSYPRESIGKLPNVMDNGLLKVVVNGNGTIDVTDYETGHTALGLNMFTDTGDRGNVWVHNPPEKNKILTSGNLSAEIAIIENSYLSCTYEVILTMNIPDSVTLDQKSRSSHNVSLKITSLITLKKGLKRVEFRTLIDNNARDHKIFVRFPTGINAESSFSEASFEVRERLIDNTTAGEHGLNSGKDLLRHPMQRFVDISNGKKSIALFTKGLPEFETLKGDDGAIVNLTLLRAVTQKFPLHADVFYSPEERREPSQCSGEHIFEYSVFFHKENYLDGNVIPESRAYAYPAVAVQFGKGKKGKLPLAELSFFTLQNPQTVVGCIKQAEDSNGIILRLNNLTDKNIEEKISFFAPIEKAFLCNMNEEKIKKLDISDSNNEIEIKLKPYRIETILLFFTDSK